MSNKIICPRCFSQNFSLYGKDKDGYQKYICKNDGCNHHFSVIKSSVFLEEVSKLPNAINLKRLKTNINLVIEALYMYFLIQV